MCAGAFNAGDVKAALSGCDKAIAADPNKADAWFIKGSLMFADSTTGPGGKIYIRPSIGRTGPLRRGDDRRSAPLFR